ncbi:MAG: 4Fe-4S binding protein [Spirochaetes bacterium]|nr:4Fe-4S binding protein [Spirochaetota bacterium]
MPDTHKSPARWKVLKIVRIGSQAAFLLVFVILFVLSLDPFSATVNPFLRFDPLILLTSLRTDPLTLLPVTGLVVLALVVGRFFCGWVCPLGAIIDLFDLALKPLRRITPFSKKSAAALGRLFALPPSLFILGGLFVTVFFIPPVLQFFHPHVWIIRIFSLSASGLVFLGFLVVLSAFARRVWCTHLCPLGAFYGLLGSVSLFRLDIKSCRSCGTCDACPTGAALFEERRVAGFRCILCFDFEHKCPSNGFTYGVRHVEFDKSRREFLKGAAALGAGLAAGAVLFLLDRPQNSALLRPPGVEDEELFVTRCLRCFQCVRSCPNGIIKATGLEAGLDSLGTPHIEFADYGCDYYCQVCQEVCPNLAIPLLPLPEKQRAKIGLASINETKCVVYADGTSCLVCEEFCPVPQKAVKLFEREMRLGNETVVLQYPSVEKTLCIGCGICEANCPASPVAITVKKIREGL